MAAVDPAGEKQRQLASVAYYLDQAWQRVLRAPSADAENLYASALRRVSRWADANPTHQLIDSTNPQEESDTRQLALLVGISGHPASVLAFNKIKERHPDVLTKEFGSMTLADHIVQAIQGARGEERKVLQEKLNPGRDQMVKMDRLFGTLDNERPASQLPRGLQGLIREQLTGIPLNKQRASVTKKGGRRKSRNTRKARKTKRAPRKTK